MLSEIAAPNRLAFSQIKSAVGIQVHRFAT